MGGRIQPIRRVDEVRVVIRMRPRTAFFGDPIPDPTMRQNAQAISRLVGSIAGEHNGYSPEVEEVAEMVCPECGFGWEIDPADGMPACCERARDSWAEGVEHDD